LAWRQYNRIGSKKHGGHSLDRAVTKQKLLGDPVSLLRSAQLRPWLMERAMAVDGLTTLRSRFGPKETMNRLEAEVKARGMTVFAHIDHAEGAEGAGLSLRPTEVLIFGNAKAGTPLMQSAPTIGIDLPLKALIWQDASGDTWLSYNEPSWLANRHVLASETAAVIDNMSAALSAVAKAATSAP
jgi:uncharacterized protein (DUF302 family)